MTFGIHNDTAQQVLEAKVKGLIRSNISSGPMPSQNAIKYVLEHHEQFNKEIQANINTLQERYAVTKEVVYDKQYQRHWQAYDFNSGYFMALKVNGVDPEELRVHLINKYSIGQLFVYDKQYQRHWQAYDFNSGYFMALKVNGVDPEELRVHLINKYSIGIIALNDTDIRVAFSCVEKMIFRMYLIRLLKLLKI